MKLTIFENFRALFYTPFYLCHKLGAYRDEGLDVCLAPSSEPGRAVSDLLAGRALVAWGGPMRVMQGHDKDRECQLVSFCQVVSRDPFYLVGRKPNPAFHFGELCDLTLATVSEVPTPWLCLQEDLRRAGIDPNKIVRLANQTMDENARALRAGKVDVIQVFEPFVDNLLQEGSGHIWHPAATRGPTSYTTFLTTKRALGQNHDILLRITRAMYRVQKWLDGRNAIEIANAVASYLPNYSHDTIVSSVRRYQFTGIWAKDPFLSPEGFVRLKCGLLSGGFIDNDVPHDRCVDNTLAEYIKGKELDEISWSGADTDNAVKN